MRAPEDTKDLRRLADVDPDAILERLNTSIARRMPTYDDLYRRWERLNWRVSDLEHRGRSLQPGRDSGSLVYTAGSGRGFGLLFAGSDQGGWNGFGVTYLNPLDFVLSELDVRLLT